MLYCFPHMHANLVCLKRSCPVIGRRYFFFFGGGALRVLRLSGDGVGTLAEIPTEKAGINY